VPRILVIDDRDRTVELCHRHLSEFEYVTRCDKSIPCQVCEEQHRDCHFKCAHDYFEAEHTLQKLERLPDLVVLDLHFALPRERLLPEIATEPSGTVKRKEPSDDSPQSTRSGLERLRRRQGLYILQRLRDAYPRLPIVMLTTTDTELGAERPFDPLVYLCQNEIVDSRTLVGEIRRALALSHESQEGAVFWGKSPKMAAVRRTLSILSHSPLPTLIEGETGTGKSYLAEHFIHRRSGVKGGLIITDLSTVPAALLPAHLFGVRKGAYTGATADHAGVFEQAHLGTLFLDEIANLDLELQHQLLLVLERNIVTRLGDDKPRPCVTKLIAATNQNLSELVQQGRFRADLYMRLNPATQISLPPLRERREDIADLVRFAFLDALKSTSLSSLTHAYLVRYPTTESFDVEHNAVLFRRPSAKAAKPNAFTVFIGPEALERITAHAWPGNHRELRLFAINALVFALCQMLEESTNTAARLRAPAVLTISDSLVDQLLRGTARNTPSPGQSDLRRSEHPDLCLVEIPKSRGFAQISMHVERQYLEQLYLLYQGNLEQLAKRLLGTKGTERKVHLRLNQLGLGIKSLRQKLAQQNVKTSTENQS